MFSPEHYFDSTGRLVLQGFPGHDPHNPLDDARVEQAARGDNGEETLAAPRRHGRQHVTRVRLVSGDGVHDAVDQALMATQLLAHDVPKVVTPAATDEQGPGL